MNPKLEDIFQAVFNQVIEISTHWKLYLQLFDSGTDNVDLLNASGSFVFGLLQRLMLYDITLAVARLTDPEASGQGKHRNENASLKNLVSKVRKELAESDSQEIEKLLEQLDARVEKIRLHRNKLQAHADLKTSVQGLPGIAYDDLESAMAIIHKLVTIAGRAAGHNILHFDVSFTYGTDGRKLLETLRIAQHESKMSVPAQHK
ncbi:MAG: hypothetical protein FJX45_05000 [Alphaproteobacteria bacterium]|nr:hypothetical protein [Alphaproteobacteria bacterium]MBM3651696.1 hypothetical protein [Alphaproteobacteria bacterium]